MNRLKVSQYDLLYREAIIVFNMLTSRLDGTEQTMKPLVSKRTWWLVVQKASLTLCDRHSMLIRQYFTSVEMIGLTAPVWILPKTGRRPSAAIALFS